MEPLDVSRYIPLQFSIRLKEFYKIPQRSGDMSKTLVRELKIVEPYASLQEGLSRAIAATRLFRPPLFA